MHRTLMDWSLAALSAVRTMSALCAGVLMLLAYRAHARTRNSPLRSLAIASLLLVIGFIGAGILYQVTGNLLQATIVEAPFTLAALLMIMFSLFGRDLAKPRVTSAEVEWRTRG